METNLLPPQDIHLLASEVIDQIAAGEVVERPGHLVKEIVENAIDAGATQISIWASDGGRTVAVEDNGCGIKNTDLLKALSRHGTSKIKLTSDLNRLATFGFRGEALASIASVSQLKLISRPQASSTAFKITSQFGAVTDATPAAGNPGTRIEVTELFQNLPARLKFLKSDAAEIGYLRQVIKAAALAQPSVGFKVYLNGKLEYHFDTVKSIDGFLKRASDVLSTKLYATAGEYEGIKVEICFSSPENVMGNSKGIWIFVQNRWIQDRSLQAAITEAYRGLLMHGEFPIAALKVSVDPSFVDVNIHPAKSQVKFQNQSQVFKAVHRILRSALELAPWMEDGSKGSAKMTLNLGAVVQPSSISSPPQRTASIPAAINERALVRPSLADFVKPWRKENSPTEPLAGPARSLGAQFGQIAQSQTLEGTCNEVAIEPLQSEFFAYERSVGGVHAQEKQRFRWQDLKVIGQFAQTYLICEQGDRLVMIDQHAAHERVAYERLIKASRDGDIEVQNLLIPLLIECEAEEVEVCLESQNDLRKIGIEIESMGPRTLAVRTIPALLKESAVFDGIKEFARKSLERGGSGEFEQRFSDVFARMACHSVVRAGQILEPEQQRALLQQMDEFPLSSFCPHGRPVSLEVPLSQIERDFGRTV